MSLTVFVPAAAIYLIISAIVSFDKKQIKMVKKGILPSSYSLLPLWMEYLYWLEIFLLLGVFLIDWKLGLIVFLMRSVFQFLGLLQGAGALLVRSVKKFRTS